MILLSNVISSKLRHINYFLVILVCLVIFNIFILKSAIFGLILLVFWLSICARLISSLFIPKINHFNAYLSSVLLIIGGLILILVVLSYAIAISMAVALAVFVIISLLSVIIGIRSNFKINIKKLDLSFRYLLNGKTLVYLILILISYLLIAKNQTASAILSPWEVVPSSFFICYILSTLVLLMILFSKNKKQEKIKMDEVLAKLVLISLHLLLTLSVAVIVYRIGFGFDGFVHRAAEVKLAELGYILPQPLYYIGQYVWVVWLVKIFSLPLEWTDKLLLPVMSAILLPPIIYLSLKKILPRDKYVLPCVVGVLLIGSPLFFYSVPQNLANLFLLILIFRLFSSKNIGLVELIMALAILTIHPLAGIPALILLTLKYLFIKRKSLVLPFVLIASVLVPLFFVLASVISAQFEISFGIQNLSLLGQLIKNNLAYLPFNSPYHFMYLIYYNWLILFLFIFIFGISQLKKRTGGQFLKLSLLFILSILLNLFLTAFVQFDSVIDYEQIEFIKRLGQILILSASPLFLIGLYFILQKIDSIKFGKYIALTAMAAVLGIAIYFSYPQHDAFSVARGYAVSKYDVAAVKWIDKHASTDNYTVLSNQSTAAAGLREFGFKTYLKNGLFYYPIPTSSPLYELYLKMVYDKPDLKYVQLAFELTGADKVYFVINNYWLDAQKKIKQAGQIADEKNNIQNKVWIFEFVK